MKDQTAMPVSNNVLILGSGGAMGSALVKHFTRRTDVDHVFAVSRSEQNFVQSMEKCMGEGSVRVFADKVTPIKTQYNEKEMAQVVASLSDYAGTFSRVCLCHGILHNDHIFPEKRTEDLTVTGLQETFYANAMVPALWLKLLMTTLCGERPCKLACFSARVGSTGDNRLGGWYSYRASKAALNSLLKTFAIEYRRRASNVKLIAFHPGTVRSQMSEPFRGSVPKDKLFEADFVADRLAALMDSLDCDGELSYLDYAGKSIPW